MKNRQNIRIWSLLCVILFSLFFIVTACASEKEKEEIQNIRVSPIERQEGKNLATFIQYETAFSRSLVDLKDNVGKLVDPENYKEKISEIREQIDLLEWQVQRAKTDLNMPHKQLIVYDIQLARQELALKNINKPLEKSIHQLSQWEVEWSKRKWELIEWKKVVTPESTLKLVDKNIDELTKTTATALGSITSKLHPAIKTGRQVSKLRVKIYGLMVGVDERIRESKRRSFEQTMQPIFSADFFKHFKVKLFNVALENVRHAASNLKKIFNDHLTFFLCNIFGIIFLAANIKYMGRNINPSEKCYIFTQKPVSVSIFFFLLFYLIFHITLVDSLINLVPILQVLLSFTVILLAPIFTRYSPRERLLLRFFALLLIITWLCRIVTLPAIIIQLSVAVLSFSMICYCAWRSYDLQKKQVKGMRRTGLHLIIAFFTITCIGMIFGYKQIAFYIFSSSIVGVVAAHVVFLIYLITHAALELIFTRIPAKIIQTNHNAIVNRLAPLVGFMSGIIYLFIILEEWQIYPSRAAAVNGLSSIGITFGATRIDPESILLTVGLIYIILMISRAIQKTLLDSIFPRYRVELGVQLSMVRLIHYSVLVIGFIILLNILGFELTKLAILGGALGVGIGFGLQAIVNNFVSGLILLFERPIKVGDTVEIGDDFGEVKKLGLRATIVSTFDNAEIVIPNSDLITAPVTNWTLSGRQARVKIPIGVAYGSDIQKVLEILMSCAKEHPMVLTEPGPQALFLAFGSSSLDIELRVWTPDFSDRMLLQSELNQEIKSEFSLAGIEIPFPQTDLHLRSIDDKAAATLNGFEK